jgi:hypothetical protein
MGKISRWDVTDIFAIELIPEGHQWFLKGRPLRDLTVSFICQEFPKFLGEDSTHEIEIKFRSKGYSDPGKTYGEPETCYPPEEDDERTVEEIHFDGKAASAQLQKMIEDDVGEEVMGELLDEQELPEPDYDDGPKYDPDED